MKKVLLVLGLALASGLSACKVTEVVKGPEIRADSVVSVGINPSVFAMTIGQQQQFRAEVKNALGVDIPGKTVLWASSDPTKATVTAAGVVTAVATGTATIRATVDGVIAQAPIVVTEVPVSTVLLIPSSTTVFLGQTVTPRVELRGSSNQLLTNRFVQWSSSNTNIATVSQLGAVTTVGVGTVTITATSEGKSANMTLTVAVVPAAQVELTEPNPIRVGRTTPLQLTVRDSTGSSLPLTGRSITWTISNPSVASITNTGVVRGLSTGNISIGVVVDGKLTIMNTSVGVVDIDTILVAPNDTIPLLIGFTKQLTASAVDINGVVLDDPSLAGRTFFWASETPSIAVVSNTGLVTGVSEGEATIRVSVNGKITRRKIKIIL